MKREPSEAFARSGIDVPFYGRVWRSPIRGKKECVDGEFISFAGQNPIFRVPSDLYRWAKFDNVEQAKEFAKYGVDRPSRSDFGDAKLLTRAMSFVQQHFSFYMETGNMRVLTYDEALRRLPRDTSTGFGLNMTYPLKGQWMDRPEAVATFLETIESWDSDEPIPQIFLQVGKGEIRKVGKPTRTILPGPYDLHVFQVMYFSAQNDALVASHQHTWFGCGVSQYYGGWDRLGRSLLRFGGEFFESDVSNWDRSVPAWLRWAITQIRFCWLPLAAQTRQNWKRVFTASELCINSFVCLEEGDITRKFGGTSSGEYNTLDDNCLIHALVVFLILLRMRPELSYNDIAQGMLCKFVGDDNLGAVRLERWPWFRWEDFQKGYNDLGFTIKYINHSAHLMEREFLSLRFTMRHGMLMAKPSREKVLCALAYGGKYGDPGYRLLRALEYRLYVWPDPQLFALVDSWCRHLHTRHKVLIEREVGDFPWSVVRSQWKTEQEIIAMHTNFE